MKLARFLALLAALSSASTVGAIACSDSHEAPPGLTDAAPASEGGDARVDGHGPLVDGGTPFLLALGVSTSQAIDASPSVTLSPPFAPDIHDYSVRCAAGTNRLVVSMTASPGAESLLTRPTASPTARMQTLLVEVTENQAIVAAATDGVATVEYWVRCLPKDFPALVWTEHPDAGTRPPGYYLVGNLYSPKGGAYAVALDAHGVPVWYASVPTTDGVFDVDNVVSGAISFTPWTYHSSPYEIHSLDPLVTTYLSVPSQDEHELRALPNGDFLLIASPVLSGVDLTGLVLPLSDGGVEKLGSHENILNCGVLEIAPSGTIVWRWLATDHLDPAKDCTWPEPAVTAHRAPEGGSIVDTFHCNAIDVDPDNGNLLVSARAMDSIFYIEKSTGTILWKMGGARYTKDDGAYVPVSDAFHRQHDARFQPDWEPACAGGRGQISLFDDETDLPGPARALVYEVNVGHSDKKTVGDCGSSADAGVAGATVTWQRKGLISSASMGSFRISADGSRVIGWGLQGTGNLVFTEVDFAGDDLLDFAFGDGEGSYRAIKVPLSALDLEVLRATAGL